MHEDIELVLALALAKQRDERFAGVTAFADAFEAAVAGELSDDRRARARRVLAEMPWGAQCDIEGGGHEQADETVPASRRASLASGAARNRP